MKRINIKDMVIGFLLAAVLFLGVAMAAPGSSEEKFCSMVDMGKDHFYVVTTEGIYHVKIKRDKVIDTSRVADIGDLRRDLVERY